MSKIANKFDLDFRRCKLRDYNFVFSLLSRTIFLYVKKYRKIDKDLFDENFKKNFKQIVIMSRGKRRIGLFMLKPGKDYLYILRIALSPAYQGRGIGAFLMNYFEDLGYNKIVLEVWENNPAVKFYKKLGYKIVKKRDHKFFMEKKL